MSDSRVRSRSALSSIIAVQVGLPSFRPGSSVSATVAPYPAASSSEAKVFRADRGALRQSLKASVLEGIAAEVVCAFTTGAVLTAWALHLGCSPIVIGFLGSLPFFSQFVQFPAAWITGLFGARRTAIFCVAASRQTFLPLIALPFLPLPLATKQLLLVALAAISGLLGVLGNNAWVAWMGDLVPVPIRGRYFGRRTAINTVGATIASLVAGFGLDYGGPQGVNDFVLSTLALLACAAGGLTTYFMVQQHDPRVAGPRERLDLSAALLPFSDPRARRFLVFQLAWNGAVGVSASFFVVHMIQYLRLGFVLIAIHAAAAAFIRILVSPMWGRALDRFGARPVLIVCSVGLPLTPALWLFAHPDVLWPLVVDAIVAGVLWSGHNLATFNLPLTLAPQRGRPFYLAAFATAAGLAFGLATLVGGFVAQAVPSQFILFGQPFVAMQVVFFLSSLGRVVACFLAVRIIEPESRSSRELVEMLQATLAGMRLKVFRFPAMLIGR